VEKEESSSSVMDAEQSEVLPSSPNRRARNESREGNGGGGGLSAAWRKEKWERGREGEGGLGMMVGSTG
jgi:hypothetical protein